jgi:hypothetical protein
MSTDQNTAAAGKPGTVKLKTVAQPYTFAKDGYPLIRKALLTFGIVLFLSIVLVTACRYFLLQVEPDRAQAQAAQNAAREKFNQAESERIEIRDFQPKFTQLRERGFYGTENRLFMLELIKSIQEKRRLLPISYEFSPQQLVPLDPTLLAPTLELHASRIGLRFGLLHELDLFHFLRDLRDQGFYTAQDCTITPTNTVSTDPLAARLNAECTLYWVTVGEPAAVDPAEVPQ